jgi:hypothetical protein
MARANIPVQLQIQNLFIDTDSYDIIIWCHSLDYSNC